MSITKRFTAFVLAFMMLLGCVTVTGFADDTRNATFTIKMGKITDGVWAETTEVNPGDDVVARIYLTTDFYAAPQTLEFFYDADFYEDNYKNNDELDTMNPYYLNKGYYPPMVGRNTAIQNRTNNCLTDEQQARYNWIYLVIDYDDETKCEIHDGSEYLLDIELKVKDTASGQGWFTVLPETFKKPAEPINPGNFVICEQELPVLYATKAEYNHLFSDMGLNDSVNISVAPETEGDFMEIPESENKLVVTTKFFREENGEWIETTKAKRGETLKARVYLDSAYPTNSGELLFFYDNTFFTNAYGTGENNLTVNTASGSFAAQNDVEGWFYTPGSTGAQAKVAKMVNNGYIDQNYVSANDYFYVIYEFGPGKTNTPAFDDDNTTADTTVDNGLWFCEFELTVADNAEDEGDLIVNPDTIASEQHEYGAFNVPKGYEGSYNTFGMWLWDAEVVRKSNPVSLESKVTFKLDGGTVNGSGDPVVIEDYIGSTYTVPAPVKEDCTLLGWYVEGDQTQTLVTPVAEIPYDDITYVAKWAENVTVTFKDSDDENITYYTKSGKAGSEFPQSEIANPTNKEGFGFAGWAATPNGDTVALPSVYPDEDTVYYALWEANSYPVTYNIKNEVTGATVTTERYVAFGDDIPTTNIYEVPEGYEFDGWYTDESCAQGTELASGATMPAEPVILYAKLTAKEYTVTFDLNGGNIGGNESNVEVPTPYMGAINAPGTPVKDHNSFRGWDPILTAGDVLDTPANRTYVATWESDPYTITYYKSEADKAAGTAYETGEYKPGASVDAVADPHIDGQTFTSWKYYDATGNEINFTGTMPEHNVVAVAQYTPIEYTLKINYYIDGTETPVPGIVTNPYEDTYAYNDTYSVTSPTGIEGFKLADGQPEVVTGTVNNDSLDDPDDPECTTITVNVYYVREEYTITWYFNGGRVGDDAGPQVDTYAFGATNITEPAPTREGYTFDGWDQDTPATMPAQNLERTAQWTAIEYPVTFKLEGGKVNDSTDDVTRQVAYDSDIAPLDPAPTRDGYTFQGWSATQNGSVITGDNLGKMDDINGKTFYAVWLADNAPYYIDVYRMDTEGSYPDSPSQTYPGEDGKVTGDPVSADPADYAQTGFTYDADAANVLEGEIPATGELRLKIYYKRDKHNVKFIADGVTLKDEDLYYEETITKPEPATYEKEGYTFQGWTNTEGSQLLVEPEGAMGVEDLTYYAVYEINTWTLTINYIDEEGNPVPGTTTFTDQFDYNEDYSVTSPTVEGYTLKSQSQATVSGTMPNNDL
ncbi:MAG: InlB B-repeat-containing protein, partial [Clostridia bacterium]|nr:InlB B-repeat-containing protein [Clostridia bacterium]